MAIEAEQPVSSADVEPLAVNSQQSGPTADSQLGSGSGEEATPTSSVMAQEPTSSIMTPVRCHSAPRSRTRSPVAGVAAKASASTSAVMTSDSPAPAERRDRAVAAGDNAVGKRELFSKSTNHHRQPWAQCPLVSDAIVTIAAHRCLSRAAWLNSCRVVPHHCSMSSDHSR